MSSRTASSMVAEMVAVSHDLAISGYSITKNRYAGGTYKSARFVAGGRRWHLRYYPNGCSSCGYSGDVTYLLYHDPDNNGADEDKVPGLDYQISLLGPDGNPVQRYKSDQLKVTYDEPSVYQRGLIGRKALEESGYIRDDAFSVRCEFRVAMMVTETTVPPLSESEEPTHVPADVHDRLVRFISDEVPTDVTLEVGDETFRAHRRLLAAQSPVFAALFGGPMSETTAPSLRIDGMEPRVFKAMLDFIYRGHLLLPQRPVNDEGDHDDAVAMTQHLLVAADRYDLERLKSICAERLRRHINTSTVATTLDLAHRHGCHALKDACYDFLAPHGGNVKAIFNSQGFEQLVNDFPSVVVELLARVSPSPH